jgi:hypothetical protein
MKSKDGRFQVSSNFKSQAHENVTKFLATLGVLTVVATPAFAVRISAHRAAAIKACTRQAEAEYGPSGVRDWRRFYHASYAACMAKAGEPE